MKHLIGVVLPTRNEVSFYISDGTANQLTAELNADNTCVDFAYAEWRTTRLV